jgi:hypothetical protein
MERVAASTPPHPTCVISAPCTAQQAGTPDGHLLASIAHSQITLQEIVPSPVNDALILSLAKPGAGLQTFVTSDVPILIGI